MPVSDYNDLIDGAAAEWNVHPALLRAIMSQESGGRPGLTSPKGAAGLMQIIPSTARELGVTDVHDPKQSIYGGAKYLSQMLEQYKGNPVHALAAYNAGPGRIDGVLAGRGQLPAETAKYIPQVMARYSQFANAANPPDQGPALNPTPTPPTTARYGNVNDVTTVASQAEADKLPTGARYVLPDGTPGRVSAPMATPPPKATPAAEGDATFLARTGGAKAPVESDEVFLARTAGPRPPVEDDNAFLARTGGAVPAATKTPVANIPDPQAPDALPVANAPANTPSWAPSAGPTTATSNGLLAPLPVMAANSLNPTGPAITEAKRNALQAFGPDPVGAPEWNGIFGKDANMARLRAAGIIPDPATGQGGALRSINEAVLSPILTANDALSAPVLAAGNALVRGVPAAYAAAQGFIHGALTSNGVPEQAARDLVSIPDAFAGSPGHFQTPVPGALPGGAPAVAPAPLSLPQIATLDMRTPLNKLTAAINNVPDIPPTMLNKLTGAIQNADALPMRAPRPDAMPAMEIAPPAPVNGPASLPRTNALDLRPGTAPAEAPAVAPAPVEAPGTASAIRPTEAAPKPPGSAPTPQAVGAQVTPSADAGLTDAQTLAYRSTAEGQKLLEPQPAGPDNSANIPGVNASAVEIEQKVALARELKALGITTPGISQEMRDVAAAHSEARGQFFAGIAKSPVDVENAIATRSAQADADLTAAWKAKKDVDATPVLSAASEILNSPDGRRPVVRSAIAAVTNELRGPDGQMIADPEMLYGVRKHIDDLLSRESGASDPLSVRAQASLMKIKTALDGVIEHGAPGFKQYLQNFSDASRPIDAMTALQKLEPKLYNSQNQIQYAPFQRMMRQIVDSRQAPGINDFKSIPDETMAELWTLRDNLRRSASAQELARASGSDTVQNVFDTVKAVAGKGADLLVHGLLAATTHGGGNVAYEGLKAGVRAVRANRLSAENVKRGMELIHPTTPLVNRLDQP